MIFGILFIYWKFKKELKKYVFCLKNTFFQNIFQKLSDSLDQTAEIWPNSWRSGQTAGDLAKQGEILPEKHLENGPNGGDLRI